MKILLSAEDMYVLYYIIGSVISLVIVAYIVKAIFDIDKIVSYQKAQVKLLAKMANEHGVPENEIDSVLIESKIKPDPNFIKG